MERRIFREWYLFSKSDVLKSLKMMVEHVESDDYDGTSLHKQARIKYYKKLIDLVKASILPELDDDEHFYEYGFEGRSLNLNMSACSELEVNLETGEHESATITNVDILLSVPAEYISIGKYATIHDVKPTTVNRWIKSGKLKLIRHQNNECTIAEFSSRPSGSFEATEYSWEELSEGVTNLFPILKGKDRINIWKTISGNNYKCTLYTRKGSTNDSLTVELPKKDVERLMYALNIEENVEIFSSECEYIPYIRG